VLNLFGVRPGNAYNYEQKAMPSVIHFDITFESTHEAIEALVLPPPLESDRTEPPIVTISYFTNAEVYAYDGRNTPYQAVMLTARTQWADRKGVAGWEFVDGLHGDKTDMDIMGPWGLHFGMLKKFADIKVSHTGAHEFNVEVTRRGKLLVKLGLRAGDAVDESELRAFNQSSLAVFGVREFPNVDYTGYIERSIVASDPVTDDRVARAWHADSGFVEFHSGELDELADLPVHTVTGAYVYDSSSRKEHFGARYILADLLHEHHTRPETAHTQH
jgi:hypothetical protein